MADQTLSAEIDIKTNSPLAKKQLEALEKELEKLNKTLKAVDVDSLSREIDTLDKSIASLESSKADRNIQSLDKSLMGLNKTTKEANKNMSGMNGAFAKLAQVSEIINTAIEAISSFQRMLEFLSDPKKLKRLAVLLNILGSLASIRGFQKTGDALKNLSIRVNDFSNVVQDMDLDKTFIETAKKLEFLSTTVEVLKTAFTGLGVSAIALGGVGVGRELSDDFDKAVTKINKDLIRALDRAGTSLRKLPPIAIPLKGIKNSIASIEELSNSLSKNAIPGLIRLADRAFLAGTAMTVLGANLRESENVTISVTGNLLILAGILSGSLGIALTSILKLMGELSIMLGVTLFNAMNEFAKIAEKGEVELRAFEFTVRGFGKSLGEEAVGSLQLWNEQIAKVVETSTFGSGEVRKAVSLIVKESQVLGLSVRDNIKLLKTSADVAAATGKSIEEVAIALASGIAGNAQAVLSLGINLKESNSHLQDYAKTQGKAFKDMTDSEKIAVRFKTVLSDTLPLLGAASDATNTLSGSQRVLARNLDMVKSSLGSVGVIQKAVISLQTKFAQALLALGPGILGTVGDLQDFISVSLIVFGVVAKYTALITTFVFIWKVAQGIIGSNTLVQITLSKALAIVSTQLGVQTVAVKGATGVWLNFGILLKGVVVQALKSVWAAFLGLAGAIKVGAIKLAAFLIPLAPMIIKIGLVVGVVALLARAISDLSDEMGGFSNVFSGLGTVLTQVAQEMGFISRNADEVEQSFASLAKGAAFRLLRIIISLVKLAFLPLAGALLSIVRATIKFKTAIETNEEKLKELKVALLQNDKAFIALGKASQFTIGSLASFGNEAEIAKLRLAVFGSETDKLADKVGKNGKAIAQNLDPSEIANKLKQAIDSIKTVQLEMAEIGKSQVDIINLRSGARVAEISKLRQQLEITKQLTPEAEKQLGILTSLVQKKAALQIEQLRLETAKQMTRETAALSDQLAKAGLQGQDLAKKELEFNLRNLATKKLQLQEEGLLSAAAQANLSKQAKILKDIEKAKGEKARLATIKQIEKANTNLENQLSLMGLEGEELAKAQLDIEMDRIDAKMEQLALEGKLSKEAIAGLERQKDIIAQIQKAGQKAGPGFDEAIVATGAGLESFAGTITSVVDDIFSASESASEEFGLSLTKANDMLLRGFERLPEFIETSIDSGIELMDQMIARAPEVIEAMAERLPFLIDKLVAAFMRLLDALPAIIGQIAEQIPDIVSKILDQLPAMILKLSEAIPQIIAALLQQVPQIITNILDRLPEIISALIEGLIGAMGEVVAALIDVFIAKGGAFKIALSITKAFIKMIPAIVSGIAKGLKRALTAVFSGFKIPASTVQGFLKKVEEGVKKIVTALTGVNEELFAVIDIPGGKDELAEAQKQAEASTNALEKAGQDTADFLKKTWMWIWDNIIAPLMDGLKSLWLWFFHNIFEPFGDMVKRSMQWVIDNIYTPLAGVVSRAWQWVIDKIYTPYAALISSTWQWVIDKIYNPLEKVVSTAFNWVLINIFQKMGGFVSSAFKWVVDNIMTPMGSVFEGSLTAIGDFFAFKFPNLLDQSWKKTLDFFRNDIGGILKRSFEPVKRIFNQLNLAARMLGTTFRQAKIPFMDLTKALNKVVSPFQKLANALNNFSPSVPGVGGGGKSSGKSDLQKFGESIVGGGGVSFGLAGQAAPTGGISRQGARAFNNFVKESELMFEKQFEEAAKVLKEMTGATEIRALTAEGKREVIDEVKRIQADIDAKTKGILTFGGRFATGFRDLRPIEDTDSIGGTIPGFANGGLVDSVHAMLTPGEFVLRQSAVQGIGQSAAQFINRTGRLPKQPAADRQQNLTIVFEPGSIAMQGVQEPDRFIDELIEQMRRRGIDGDFVMSASGLRETG